MTGKNGLIKQPPDIIVVGIILGRTGVLGDKHLLGHNLKATLATSAVREVFRDWCFREGPSFRVNAASSITKFEALKLLVEGDPTHCYAAAIRFLSSRGTG